jgi:GNAT superfamily N-acetyltransferase
MMVQLVPMSSEVFAPYLANCITDYAREKTSAGHWFADEALAQAQASFQRLLPAGLATPNHYFFSIVDDATSAPVGGLWFLLEGGTHRSIWLYDLYINADQRRKGYGRGAMLALEANARELGVERIDLHVFAHNRAATELYMQVGYTVSSLNMYKLVAFPNNLHDTHNPLFV